MKWTLFYIKNPLLPEPDVQDQWNFQHLFWIKLKWFLEVFRILALFNHAEQDYLLNIPSNWHSFSHVFLKMICVREILFISLKHIQIIVIKNCYTCSFHKQFTKSCYLVYFVLIYKNAIKVASAKNCHFHQKVWQKTWFE